MRVLRLSSVFAAAWLMVGCGGVTEYATTEAMSIQEGEVALFRPSIESHAKTVNATIDGIQSVAINSNPQDGTWSCNSTASGQTSIIEIADGELRDFADGAHAQVWSGYGLVGVEAQTETGAPPTIEQVAKVGAMTATLPGSANVPKSSFEIRLIPEGGIEISTFDTRTGIMSVTDCDRVASA